MLKIGRLIIMILCLAVSPVLAADNCLLANPADATGKYATSIIKQSGKQQTDESFKTGHNCCHYQFAVRVPSGEITRDVTGTKKRFILSDRICSPFGERPPLEPPVAI